MSTYLVSGGTGRIGTAFVHEIAGRGHTIRVGTRDPSGRAADLRRRFGPGAVEPVSLPAGDDDALDAAFAGVEGALLVAPFTDMTRWHEVMAAAAKRAGVKHLVKVSVTGARADARPETIPGRHFAGEEALRASGVPSTMIRPTIFGQHFLGLSKALFRPGDPSIHLPTGGAKIAFLDCRDIAACAAAILTDDEKRAAWAGKAFELTGPTALTASEIAETLSLAGDREISWVDGADKFSEHAAAIGVPDGIKGIYAEAAGGWFGEVHDDEFTQITGRHTNSFAKLAFDYADVFKGR
jgi:uncharacterized protein YbjT (DUF2867 family)